MFIVPDYQYIKILQWALWLFSEPRSGTSFKEKRMKLANAWRSTKGYQRVPVDRSQNVESQALGLFCFFPGERRHRVFLLESSERWRLYAKAVALLSKTALSTEYNTLFA